MAKKKRGKPTPAKAINEFMSANDGAKIPGGCEHCDAYQIINANVQGYGGIHELQIFHDDWCPMVNR